MIYFQVRIFVGGVRVVTGYKTSEERQKGFQKPGSIIETTRTGAGHLTSYLEECRRILRRYRYQLFENKSYKSRKWGAERASRNERCTKRCKVKKKHAKAKESSNNAANIYLNFDHRRAGICVSITLTREDMKYLTKYRTQTGKEQPAR